MVRTHPPRGKGAAKQDKLGGGSDGADTGQAETAAAPATAAAALAGADHSAAAAAASAPLNSCGQSMSTGEPTASHRSKRGKDATPLVAVDPAVAAASKQQTEKLRSMKGRAGASRQDTAGGAQGAAAAETAAPAAAAAGDVTSETATDTLPQRRRADGQADPLNVVDGGASAEEEEKEKEGAPPATVTLEEEEEEEEEEKEEEKEEEEEEKEKKK